MAIEIIKHGEKKTRYIATCRECGCQFSFSTKDAERIFSNLNHDCLVNLHCPDCYTFLTLSLTNLPVTKQ